MFSKLSQIGKNLSDELSRTMEEVNSVRNSNAASPNGVGMDPDAAQKIINTQTPDPTSLVQPEDVPVEGDGDGNGIQSEPKAELTETTSLSETLKTVGHENKTAPASRNESQTPEPVNAAGQFVPNTNIKYTDLVPEIRSKMKKFVKYEEKYPILLDSYKIEKKKSSIIGAFEKVLQEMTPCSSIADVHGLKQYLDNLTSKTDMLSAELRTAASNEKRSKEEKEALLAELKTLKVSSSQLEEELKLKIQQLEELQNNDTSVIQESEVSTNATISEEEIQSRINEALKKQSEKLNELHEKALNDSKQKYEDFKTLSEKRISELTHKLTETIKSHKLDIDTLKSEHSKVIDERQSEQHEKLESVQSELKQSKKRVLELEDENKSIKIELQKSNEELETTKVDSKKLNDSLQAEIASLASQLKSSTPEAVPADISSTSEPATSLTASQKKKLKKKQKKQQNSAKEEAVEEDAKQSQNDFSSSDAAFPNPAALITLKHDYEVLQTKFDKLQRISGEYDTLKSEHVKLTRDYEELKQSSSKEIDKFKFEIETLSKRVSEYSKSISSKDEEIEGLKQDLINVGDDLVTKKDELKQLHEKTELQAQNSDKVKELKKEMEVLWLQNSTSLAEYEKSKASLDRKLEVAISEKKIAETELSSSKKRVAEVTKRNNEYENEIDRLKKDVKKKTQEIEKLTSQVKELKEASQEGSRTIAADNENLNKEILILKQDKESLERKVKELSDYKSTDVNLKLEMASLKTSLTYKEKALAESETKIKLIEEQKNSINDKFIELKVQVSELNSQNKAMLENKNIIVTKTENLKQQYNDLILKMNKVTAENNKLLKTVEEYRDRYNEEKVSKNSNSAETDSIKRRCDELIMKSKEDEDRIEVLEQELSEVRSMLQERTREAGTMRKLLSENEETQNDKLKELSMQLKRLNEDKEKLENTHTLTLKKRQKELDEIKMKYEKVTTDFDNLTMEKAELEKKLATRSPSPGPVSNMITASIGSALASNNGSGDNDKLVEALRDSLSDTENRIIALETMNGNLKKSNEESLQKLIRLNKKYKLLYQQYKSMRGRSSVSDESMSVAGDSTSPLHSRNNSMVIERSNSLAELSKTMDEVKETEEESEREKIMYIRNVLLGFLEHKEQRGILLPVIKTLLYLSDSDERKLVSCLAK